MDLLLTEQQTLLRDAATRIAAKAGPRRARTLRDGGTPIDAPIWKEIVEAGWLSGMQPEAQGGLGLGLFDLALALEQLGRQIVMVPLVEAAAASWLLPQVGVTPSSGSSLLVPALSGPDWQFADASAAVHLDPANMTLTGTLRCVPFADSADVFLVDAQVGGESALCLVRRDAPGLSMATIRQVDGSTASTLSFDGATIAADAIIARGAQAQTLATELRELLVLGCAVELFGTAQAALEMTLEHLKLRHQFGRPIGSFQALQHRVANCYVDAELNRSLLYAVAAAWDAGTCQPAMVAAAKARVCRAALDTVRAALQLHGAIGYTDEHDIGIFYKRAVVLAAKYGNEIMHVGRFSTLTLPQASG